jgi:putative transposase
MPNTYTQLFIQFIFAVKHRQSLIHRSWKNQLYAYITGIVQNKGSKMLAINGMPDHIHFFIGYRPLISIPDLVKEVKICSNDWIKLNVPGKKFSWQQGYGAFSYSKSEVSRVCKYIENQEMHHTKKTFRKEYMDFLEAFGINYDQRYLFEFIDEKELMDAL